MAALEQLCRTYWYPLYVYVRRQGYDSHDAQDLTQEFFARLLEYKSLELVDRAKGKFRSFLLAAMNHFLAKKWNRAHRQKRGGGRVILSLDDDTDERRYVQVLRYLILGEGRLTDLTSKATSDIVSDMRTFTVRELDRQPAEVLDACDHDGVVRIRRRDGRTYRIETENKPRAITELPDFAARRRRIFKKPFPAAQMALLDKLVAGE